MVKVQFSTEWISTLKQHRHLSNFCGSLQSSNTLELHGSSYVVRGIPSPNNPSILIIFIRLILTLPSRERNSPKAHYFSTIEM